MEKTNIAFLAFVAVLFGCSADNDHDEPINNNVAIDFSRPQYAEMETRTSDLSTIHGNFGVYAYTDNSTEPFMNNVEVKFADTDWTYSPARYWDYSTSSTTFIAYSPYNDLAISSGNDQSVEFLYAKETVSKDDYGKPVELNFKHANAQVCLEFYTDIAGYTVDITNDLTATPSGSYTTGYSSVTLPSPTNDNLTYSGETTGSESLSFSKPDGDISTNSESATASPTIYYAAPQGTGTSFTVNVAIRLTPTTDSHNVMKEYTATATIGEDLTHWASGYRYVYRFNISENNMRLVVAEVYKPNPDSGKYELDKGSTIKIDQEDPGKGADAKSHI